MGYINNITIWSLQHAEDMVRAKARTSHFVRRINGLLTCVTYMQPLNIPKTKDELVGFIKNAFTKAGFSKAVIALSGGVDSATSLALTVEALGVSNVFPLLLPYGNLYPQSVVDARGVIQTFNIPKDNVRIVDIQPLVDPVLQLDCVIDNIRKGNIMARMRMIVLFDHAKKRNALVVGTENKSEQLLGYFTRFGDEASDIEPLRNLYKTQVLELAKHLVIPEPILTKPPTAGLWEGQTDEGELGFSYKDADEILYQLYDLKKTIEEVVASGLNKDIVEKVQIRALQNNFKHHLPAVLESQGIPSY